jgi:peroxiredoxin
MLTIKRFGVGFAAVALAGVVSLVGASSAVAGEKTHAVIGQAAPDFTLVDLNGDSHTLSEYTQEGKIVVLEWFNPDCPFVKKHHKFNKTMDTLAKEFADDGVVWLAINSGAPGKQGAGVERNLSAVEEFGIEYPMLMDDSGEVGKAYGAKVTPHMYIINTDGVLVYAGAIDNDSSARKLGDVNYVKQALTEVLAGEPVSVPESRAYGCSVKYN